MIMEAIEIDLNPIKLSALDKSGWKTYRFDQIAQNISERIDPKNTNLDVYVGLEHIDSESIHIKRFGAPGDVSGQKLRFYEGDVIFGRRRAYQRKAGVAPCDGFCSAHALVLRANPEVICSELFPFFLHSDLFMHRAIDISVGSLSPTINWGTLREQAFLIPPIEQQKILINLFESSSKNILNRKRLFSSLTTFFKTERKYLVEKGVSKSKPSRSLRFGKFCQDWKVMKIGEFCKLVGGNAFKSSQFLDDGRNQVLRIGNLTEKGFDIVKSPVFLDRISALEERYLIPEGALVISLTGTNGKRDYGFPSLMEVDKKYLLNQRLVMILVDQEIMTPEFLHLISQMELFQGRFFLNATGTANQANVSISDVSEIEVPVPSLEEQNLIVKKMNLVRTAMNVNNVVLKNAECLNKALINQVF